jgi:Tol biopolymer transport system component/tRNA A-37 threonylcarbamoyl transferase component Bud32
MAQPGARIGHYEIVALLGAGGMGEVYKARDTRLNRMAALKVLPANKLGDAERRARFVNEAQAASALNHPNIVTIYGIDRDAGIDFIAMEFVPGHTMDQTIGRRRLKLGEVLRIGTQIADALAAAHTAGIVHRDLKPGNIMVTENGCVKVLDFGLAKLSENITLSEMDVTQTINRDKPVTEKGAILGTVAYMSPEQAEGKPVDARSDIFSFGSVLYEMVTGKRAFHGNTSIATISSILREEPMPIAGIAAEPIRRDLEKIIVRCLRKDVARRFQHIDDVKVALEELKQELDSGHLAPAGPAGPEKKARAWISAAVILLLAFAGAWVFRLRTPSEHAGPAILPLATMPGTALDPTFSPDGSQVAYVWSGENQDNFDVYVQVVGAGAPLRLTSDPAPDRWPAWSPDGRQIAFRREDSIYLISPLGGPERKLVETQATPGALSWSPDSKWLAVAQQPAPTQPAGIFLIPIGGGERRRLTQSEMTRLDASPAFSWNGRWLGYLNCNQSSSSVRSCDVFVAPLDANYARLGRARRLTARSESIEKIAWTPDDQAIIFDVSLVALNSRLWRVGIKEGSVAEPLAYTDERGSQPAVSRAAKRLAYARHVDDDDIWQYEVGGVAKKLIASTTSERTANFSPDGKKIAFGSAQLGNMQIWVSNADGSSPVQLTNAKRWAASPSWSPDGRWIAYDSQDADSQWDIYVIEAAGGQSRRITNHPADDHVPSWSPDGEWIYFGSDRTGSQQIFRVKAAGGEPPVQVTDKGGYTAIVSPDGKMLYYTKIHAGTTPLFAKPLTGGQERRVIDAIQDKDFCVTRDRVYYIGDRDSTGLYPLAVLDLLTEKTTQIVKIEGRIARGLSVSPDGKRFLYTGYSRVGSDLRLVENFQ